MNKQAFKQFEALNKAEHDNFSHDEKEVWRVVLDGETKEEFFILPLSVAVEFENQGIELRSAYDGETTAVAINDLHHFIGKQVQYNTGVGASEDDRWAELLSITASPAQGANVNLAGGVTLQACFATAVYLVKN